MTNQSFTSILKCTLGSTLLVAGSIEASATQNPNILVIILDDAGYNDFGFMGSQQMKTPNIDKLAASGVTFSDAQVTATVSGPSRAGILSGRYQQRFGYNSMLLIDSFIYQ